MKLPQSTPMDPSAAKSSSKATDPNYRALSDPAVDEERDAARSDRMSAWMAENYKPGMSYKDLLALRPPK